mgnify:FL=1
MNIKIRPAKRQDGVFVSQWLTEEKQLQMWCRDQFTYPLTEEQMNRYYKELEENSSAWGFTAVDDKGVPVGSFKMTINYEDNSAYLGFIVVSPEIRGQGLGQKMVSMAVDYAVTFLGVNRINLRVFSCNPGAKRCYEKVGFVEESYIEQDFSYKDEMWGNSYMVYNAAEKQ